MAQIRFRNLISTQTGVGSTTGKEAAQFWNENFKIVKENLEAIWSILELVVSSHNIEGIRVIPHIDPENPDIILYNTFEYNMDGDLENGDWYPLQVLFENLVGDIYQNPTLRKVIESLTPLDRFIPVESQTAVNTNNISQNAQHIKALQNNDAIQDNNIEALQNLTKAHTESIRLKANQVLEMFDIVAKGHGYKVGTTIYDQAGANVLTIKAVDANGGVLSVDLSSDTVANSYYTSILSGGQDYSINDIIPTNDIAYNAIVTAVDANGAVLTAELTNDLPTQTIGVNASIDILNGSDAIVSVTTYPTIYFQNINDGKQEKIIYYLNGDLTTPHEIVAYPDFVNIQNIIDGGTAAYYDISYSADSSMASGYAVGDTFQIDGLGYTGQITDISTSPYTITATIPNSTSTNIAGSYTTTSTSGTGVGLNIDIITKYHPQVTTNPEFNNYMDNHDVYLIDILNEAISKITYELKALINEKADQKDLDQHVTDYGNPHQVTAAQIGLENVDNTADIDKPLSSIAQTEINLLKSKFSNIKKMQVVSTKYYNYLANAGELNSNVLYNVGNHNKTYVISTSLDESDITSDYYNGDILQINGTEWQVVIIDKDHSPMIFTENIDDATEFDISGTYTLSPLTGTGEGLKLVVECQEW